MSSGGSGTLALAGAPANAAQNLLEEREMLSIQQDAVATLLWNICALLCYVMSDAALKIFKPGTRTTQLFSSFWLTSTGWKQVSTRRQPPSACRQERRCRSQCERSESLTLYSLLGTREPTLFSAPRTHLLNRHPSRHTRKTPGSSNWCQPPRIELGLGGGGRVAQILLSDEL